MSRFLTDSSRDAMHVYTRNKADLRQSVMQPGERKSVWEFIHAMGKSKPQPRHRMMPDLWAARRSLRNRKLRTLRSQLLGWLLLPSRKD